MMHRNRVTRAGLLLATAAALAATLGCGVSTGAGTSSTPVPAPNTYAYVALADPSYGVGSIGQFRVSSSGALTPLSPGTVKTNAEIFFGGVPLAIDPSNKYLFVASNGGVFQFVIGADGTISPNTAPYSSAPVDSTSIAFAGGGPAIVTNGAVLNSYDLNSAGTLGLLNTSPVVNANSMVIDPSGQFLYIDDEAYSTIAVYGFSSSGNFTLNGTIPSEQFPWSLAFSPKGMLYSVDYGAGTITEYSTDASTGIPTKVDSFTTGAGAGTSTPEGIAFDSTGAYAYVTNAVENTVSQFAVDATTGALRRNGADLATGWDPSPISVDPFGRFVFVGNLEDGTVSQFSINEDGTLSPNGVVACGPSPQNGGDTPLPVTIVFAQR